MKSYSTRRTHRVLAALAVLCAALPLLATFAQQVEAAPPEGFAASRIREVWQSDDGPVASGDVERAWMWGPGPFYTDYEPFTGGPQGNHLVQYFDKGRLEINDPAGDESSPWFVTSGLLVKEMVAGAAETGSGNWYEIGPANVAVAGDGGSGTAPTYAHFEPLTDHAANLAGQALPSASYLKREGNNVRIADDLSVPTIMLPRYEETSGHNWASPFWDYVNSPGRPGLFDWLYTLGYPITEPYWVLAPVNGQPLPILVQLFERRTLTYNPANLSETQVEMGNVGRHYWQWRYVDRHASDLDTIYTADIIVGPAPSRNLTLDQTIQIANNTGRNLDTIVLRVPWNNWKGVFTLNSLTGQGRAAEWNWRHGINLEVRLPAPLPPNESTNIALSASIAPRPVGGRTGYDRDNEILSTGDMLPSVVPFENGGWQIYPYSDLGDLGNNASARYSISIRSAGSEKFVVGGTGETVERSHDGTLWRFEADRVRDVAYVVSPRFIDPWEDTSMTRQEGDVTLRAFFLPQHEAAGKRQLELCGPALSWLSSRIGSYPFSTYTVAEMGTPLESSDNYAQEYPMAYFVPGSWLSLGTEPGTWPWYIPVHEVAHQWFYSTVGNNQLIDPWLDEGMTTYITAEYVRANFPAAYSQAWASMTNGATNNRPVSSGLFSGFSGEGQYSAAIYDTAALMLDEVRKAMGDDAFYAALQEYYSTYIFSRATPSNLTAMLQKHSEADLGSIFSNYLGY